MSYIDLDPDKYTLSDILDIFEIDSGESLNHEKISKYFKDVIYELELDNKSEYFVFLNKLRIRLLRSINGYSGDKGLGNIYDSISDIVSYETPDRSDILINPTIRQVGSTNIIEQKSIEPKETFDNKYPNDILNPIRRRTTNKVLSIDSLFRKDGYDANDFIYTIQEPLRNVISMELLNIEMPEMIYSFSEENKSNIFYIDMFDMSDSILDVTYNGTYTIVIPPGNYEANEFETVLNNLFRVEGGKNIGPSFLTARINRNNGKLIIRANDISDNDLPDSPVPYDDSPGNMYYSPHFRFHLRFNIENGNNRKLYNNAGWIMGFRNASYEITRPIILLDNTTYPALKTYEAALQSESYYGTNNLSYVYLDIDDFNKNTDGNIIFSNDNGSSSSNILAKLSISSTNPLSKSIFINSHNDEIFTSRQYFGPVNIEKLQIRLIDKFGNTVDVANNNYSFSLMVTQIYS
jgi:hypothetical protein